MGLTGQSRGDLVLRNAGEYLLLDLCECVRSKGRLWGRSEGGGGFEGRKAGSLLDREGTVILGIWGRRK